MAEPARRQDSDIEPDIRPHFGVNSHAERARDLADHENRASASGADSESNSGIDALREGEQTPPPAHTYTGTGKQPQKASFISRFKGNKKWLATLGISGALLTIGIGFLSLLPLKLEMFIKNITGVASSIPAHAVEQRTEYLLVRALATQLIMKANANMPENEAKLVFCGNGSVACSLFTTWGSEYFEKKLGFTIDVDAQGRATLGGKAQRWQVSISSGERNIDTAMREIDKHADMRKYLKEEIKKTSKSSNFVTRYLARKILMQKYGIKNWRGPPAIENKIDSAVTKLDNAKATLKTNIFKNTVGKISPRMATYLACLQGGTSCEKLISELSKEVVDPNSAVDSEGNPLSEDSEEYKRLASQKAAAEAFNAELSSTSSNSGELMSKFFSKKVIAMVGGGAAGVGILDLVFRSVDSVDSRALEQINYDIITQAYTGFGYGDEAGVVVTNEKMKVNEGEFDIETLAAATELFNEAEKSPLLQAESGILNNTGASVSRECDTAEGAKVVALEPGQLVCPERRAVKDYSSAFVNMPGWSALAVIADGWVNSVSKVIDLIGESVTNILKAIPGVEAALNSLGDLLQPSIEWLMGLIFDIPTIGPEATGANNYDALSGAIRIEQNELMLSGVDSSGKAMGGGGSLLTDQQVAMVRNSYQDSERQYYDSQPMMAKLFDANLQGSFLQQLILKTPTSTATLGQLPMTALQTAFAGQTASAATADNTANPFGLPMYGYSVNDPALTQDPEVYTPAKCEETNKAREDSLGLYDGKPHDGKTLPKVEGTASLIPTYGVSDPCALEKMVVGAALQAEGITNDQYSYGALSAPGTPTATTGSLANSGNIKDDGWAWPAPKGTKACGFSCYGGHNGMDVSPVPVGTDVYAARDGVVTHAGPDMYMTQAACTAAAPFAKFNGTQYTIMIQHTINGSRVDTLYTHLSADGIKVKVGDTVKAGDFIALSGNTGCSQAAHLHFGIYNGGFPRNAVDPTTILGTSG